MQRRNRYHHEGAKEKAKLFMKITKKSYKKLLETDTENDLMWKKIRKAPVF